VIRARDLQRAERHADSPGDLLAAYAALDQILNLFKAFWCELDWSAIATAVRPVADPLS
jgi:hypothetical protein